MYVRTYNWAGLLPPLEMATAQPGPRASPAQPGPGRENVKNIMCGLCAGRGRLRLYSYIFQIVKRMLNYIMLISSYIER